MSKILQGHTLIIEAIQAQLVVNKIKAELGPKQDEITETRTAVSVLMLEAAHQFVGKDGFNIDRFDSWCNEQEAWAKSDDAKEYKVNKLPKCWSDAKSNIRRAHLDFGINPADYKTESKLRSALNDARRERTATSYKGSLPDKLDAVFAQKLAALANMFESADDSTKDAMNDSLETYLMELHHELVGEVVEPAKVA